MQTGNRIFTIKGEVIKIIQPDDRGHSLGKTMNSIAQGKYCVVLVLEDQNIPEGIGIKWLWYVITHKEERRILLMSACPYKIGDIVEVDAVEVLIPSGFLTTASPKFPIPTEQKSFTGFVADYEYIKAFERINIADTFLGGSISWFIRTRTPIGEELVDIIKSDLRLEVIDGITKNDNGSINPDRLIQDTQAYKKNKDKLKVLIKSWDIYAWGKRTEAGHRQFKEDTREIDDIAQQILDEILNKYHALTQIHLYNGRKS